MHSSLRRAVAALLFLPLLLFSAAAAKKSTKTAKTAKSSNIKASATVRRWMRNMTLRDEVAQLVFIPFYGQAPNSRTRAYRNFMRLIRETKVGGLILLNASGPRGTVRAEPYALAAFLNRMQRLARVPLMVGADFERGASMRVDNVTVFPHAMAFGATGDPSYSRFEGEVTAKEARAIGVQWVYYPDADVNNNPDNPIINVRSFGENPQDVAAQVKAFIEGAHSDKKNYILTTAKHFPGHGDTAVDTHLNLATIPADLDRLQHLELIPFKAAIEAGVDSVMTAHIAVPALAPPDLPATLSPAILTGLLREQLGFKGLVITDSLEMGGIAQGFTSGDAAVRAIEAGADTLLMPADPDAAIRAVVAAVNSGRITRARIQESVVKILSSKEKVGLDRKRFANLEGISDVVNSPEDNERAQEIADHAVTLVRNNSNAVPLADPQSACFVVMPESRYSVEGQVFTQEVRKRAHSANITSLDPSMPSQTVDAALAKLESCSAFTIAAFSAVMSGRGSVGLSGDLPRALESMISSGKPVTMVALGNPYLMRNFPNVTAYLATFSTVPPSEVAAVKALWGEIAITGHLPVTIPGIAKYGEGILLTAKAAKPPQ
ncbi:MAG TPA: glycoside hydrolase family 3 N-terminal domain-containing protein [Bryobacteraceae bacterium]|jgi:beta-N-acetylhexosaminidase|nr:glycoside hydrolase family 3 N-terminal domain-containing protein [Bryobacteraceae bacterium]